METNCPSCNKPTTDANRFLDSAWCAPCVERTLAEQDADARERVRPQVFRL